jgi:tRNA nucleotidyltransferase (CCA-adding enzyme)
LTHRARLPEKSPIPALARAVSDVGGRLLVVGGWLRDQLRGEPSQDLDVEVFGLSPERISQLLEGFESIGRVGRQFPVWRLRHQALDIGYPRDAALDYVAKRPESLEPAFRAAAKYRDLTVNAIGWDPLTDLWIDPFRGIADLEARRLRAVDSTHFGSDPLRGLRVARLHARLEASVDDATVDLCRRLDLSDVAVERIAAELRRILLEPQRPSRAFEFLSRAGLLEVFPPVAALRGVVQDARWHPEGDVFIHTCLVIDCARQIGAEQGPREREILQWAALAHDFGKPATTTREADRVRSPGHERVGAALARDWLIELRISRSIVKAVEALVKHHLAPTQFASQGARGKAYRRLARALAVAGTSVVELEQVARADHLGRSPDDAGAGRFEAGEAFLAAAAAEEVVGGARAYVVSAQILIDRGLARGPALGRALSRAREIQDEHGWRDPERIAELVLAELEGKGPAR